MAVAHRHRLKRGSSNTKAAMDAHLAAKKCSGIFTPMFFWGGRQRNQALGNFADALPEMAERDDAAKRRDATGAMISLIEKISRRE